MLDKQLIKILSKVYKHQNATYDYDRKINTYQPPQSLTAKQQELLQSSDFNLNHIVKYTHDEVIQGLAEIIQHPFLERIVTNLLIKAVGSGFHRGIQPIFSYYFAKHMPQHTFEKLTKQGIETSQNCRIYGIEAESWQNDSENLYHLYIGYCRLGGYSEVLLDLKEVVTFKDYEATEEEKQTFMQIVDIIANAQATETPSELLKRLSKEKCLPNSNLTSRTWLIKCFAELGILKNELAIDYSIMNAFTTYEQKLEWELALHKKYPARAEVTFPISAWRGHIGINKNIAEEIVAKAS